MASAGVKGPGPERSADGTAGTASGEARPLPRPCYEAHCAPGCVTTADGSREKANRSASTRTQNQKARRASVGLFKGKQMKAFTNRTRADIWESVQRGVENGVIKDHEAAIQAVHSLTAAFIVINSERTSGLAQKYADQPSASSNGLIRPSVLRERLHQQAGAKDLR